MARRILGSNEIPTPRCLCSLRILKNNLRPVLDIIARVIPEKCINSAFESIFSNELLLSAKVLAAELSRQ